MAEHDEQRAKILRLLETAHALAVDLEEIELPFLIDRALDECRASFIPQTPYKAG